MLIPSASIKISQLDPIPVPLLPVDFGPFVESASMTTYRASVSDLANAIGPLIGGVGFASSSLSSSWASMSLSASYARHADSASVVDHLPSGSSYYYPWWFPNVDNYNLSNFIVNNFGGWLLQSGSVLIPQAWISTRPEWYSTQSNWFVGGDPLHVWGTGSIQAGNGGIFTAYPIVSGMFVGIDQKGWQYQTSASVDGNRGNVYLSGSSAVTGEYEFYPITNSPPGTFKDIFNGKWIRLASLDFYADPLLFATHSMLFNDVANGESGGGHWGHLRLFAQTNIDGSDSWNIIHLFIMNDFWSGGITAQVLHNNIYGPQIITQIRLGKAYVHQPSTVGDFTDPHVTLDIKIDNLVDSDNSLTIKAASYSGGTIRFLKEPTVDPFPLVNDIDTVNNLTRSLTFAPSPGHYFKSSSPLNSSIPCVDYNFLGTKVRIAESTENETEGTQASRTLDVTGSVGASQYYVSESIGHGGTWVVYEPTSAAWNFMKFVGGILVDSGSAASPGTSIIVSGNIPVGGIIDWAGADPTTLAPNGWVPADGRLLNSVTYAACFNALGGINNPWGNGSAGSGYSAPNFKVPDLRKRTTFGAYPGNPVVVLKSEVGSTGGNENGVSNHYHAIGSSQNRYSKNFPTNNVWLIWNGANYAADSTSVSPIGFFHSSNNVVDMTKFPFGASTAMYGLQGTGFGLTFAGFSTTPKVWNTIADPSNIEAGPQGTSVGSSTLVFDLITTFPLTNGDGSLPSYAVVHKLIRIF